VSVKVRIVDFGEAVPAALDELRQLFRNLRFTYEAAVECQLVLPYRIKPSASGLGMVRTSWEACQRRRFQELLFDREMNVKVLKMIKNEYVSILTYVYIWTLMAKSIARLDAYLATRH